MPDTQLRLSRWVSGKVIDNCPTLSAIGFPLGSVSFYRKARRYRGESIIAEWYIVWNGSQEKWYWTTIPTIVARRCLSTFRTLGGEPSPVKTDELNDYFAVADEQFRLTSC
jgi:hypothetical protein